MVLSQEPVLVGTNLVSIRTRGNGDLRRVLDGTTLTLNRGEALTIRGQSGSGKTTLLWALARLLPLDSGELVLKGAPADHIPPQLWRQRVTLVMQKPVLAGRTVLESLQLPFAFRASGVRSAGDTHTLRNRLDELGLENVDLDRPAGELSGGQTARLAVLRALLMHPDCLLLDEPTASLDADSTGIVLKMLQDYVSGGGAVVAAQHSERIIDGSKSLILNEGRLLDG